MARAAGSRGVDANVPECSRFTACECPSTDREHQRSRAGRAGQAAKVPVPARLENAQARRPRAASRRSGDGPLRESRALVSPRFPFLRRLLNPLSVLIADAVETVHAEYQCGYRDGGC